MHVYYVNLGTKPSLPYHYTLPLTNYQDSNTHCNHSKTIKTNGESYIKFNIYRKSLQLNQRQENTSE